MLDAQLSAVYEEHADYVWANLRRLGVPMPELDDAVQETFLVAFRRFDAVREGASWRPWLFGIARRVASHHRRSRGRRLRLVEAIGREPRPTVDPHDALALRHAAELAHHFLQTLSPRRREVFILADIEGHTGAEIAALLGIPQNTVWSRLRAARESFRRYLAVLDARERGAALVEAARRERMPQERKKKAMGLLAVRLAGGPGPVATLLGAVKSASISIAIGVAALITVGTVAHTGAAAFPANIEVRAEPSAGERRVAVPGPVEGGEPPVAGAAARDGGTSGDPPEAGAAMPTEVGPASGAAQVRPAQSRPASSVSPAPRRSRSAVRRRDRARGQPSTFDDEVALLRELWNATRSKSYDRALVLVARHRKRFPHGELAVERDVQEIEVLCGLGRHASARTKIARLKTPLPKRVAEACREKETTPGAAGQEE